MFIINFFSFQETKSDANCNGNASSSSDGEKPTDIDPQVQAGAFTNFRISENTIKKLKRKFLLNLFCDKLIEDY